MSSFQEIGKTAAQSTRQSLFFNTVKKGCLCDVIHLVEEHGIDVNVRDEEGKTGLAHALLFRRLAIVRYLVSHGGAKIRGSGYKLNGNYISIMEIACLTGSLDIVKFLFEHGGTDPWDYDLDPFAVLTAAVGRFGKFYPEIAEYLVKERGIDVDAKSRHGRFTILQECCWKNGPQAVAWLLKAGANVEGRDIGTLAPLHIACQAGLLPIVKLLCNHGADISGEDTDKKTALHYAVCSGRVEIVRYLVEEKGADVFVFDSNGSSPLHDACRSGHYEIAKCLVEALSRFPDKKAACLEKIDNYSGLAPLHLACQSGDVSTVRLLCEHGASLNSRSMTGKTPAHVAVLEWKTWVVKYLISEAAANGNLLDDDGFSPLHYACYHGLFKIVKCLVEEGSADVNAFTSNPGNERSTPLHPACTSRSSNVDIVKYLIAHGANVRAQNYAGDTPLHIAASESFVEAVGVLIEAGGAELLHIKNKKEKPVPNDDDDNSRDEDEETELEDEDEDKDTHRYPLSEVRTDLILYAIVECCPAAIHAMPKRVLKHVLKTKPNLLRSITSLKSGNLPLHDACLYGSRKGVVELMISIYPAAMSQRNKLGNLPFHEACRNNKPGSERAVSILYQYNPLFLVERDGSGKLPLEIAMSSNAPLGVIYKLLRESPTILEELAYCEIGKQN